MRKRSMSILGVLVATTLFVIAAGTASAGHLRLTEKEFEAIWETAQANKEQLSIIDRSGNTVTCPATLAGSFTNNTIAKVTGINVGEISEARFAVACRGAIFLTRPWHIQYGSFGGTLPNITEITIKVIDMGVEVTLMGLSCLFRTEERRPAVFIIGGFGTGGSVETIRADETVTIPATGICSLAEPLHFRGKGLLRRRNLLTSKITVSLI